RERHDRVVAGARGRRARRRAERDHRRDQQVHERRERSRDVPGRAGRRGRRLVTIRSAPGAARRDAPGAVEEEGIPMKGLRKVGPPLLLLAPSLVLVAIFVYGLIAANFATSVTDNHTAAQATGQKPSVVVWF